MGKDRSRYDAYLRSEAWQAMRRRAFKFYGRRCARCPSTGKLHVHHKTYARFGSERLEDVEVLCEPCHMLEHGIAPPSKKPKKTRKPRQKLSKSERKASRGYKKAKPVTKQKKNQQLIEINERLHRQQAQAKERRAVRLGRA